MPINGKEQQEWLFAMHPNPSALVENRSRPHRWRVVQNFSH